jgi:hypothetical protein
MLRVAGIGHPREQHPNSEANRGGALSEAAMTSARRTSALRSIAADRWAAAALRCFAAARFDRLTPVALERSPRRQRKWVTRDALTLFHGQSAADEDEAAMRKPPSHPALISREEQCRHAGPGDRG